MAEKVFSRDIAEGLLVNWANVDFSDSAAVEEFRKRYASTLGVFDAKTVWVLQEQLRLAWDTPDSRARDWYCIQLRVYFHQLHERAAQPPPPKVPGVISYRVPAAFPLLELPPKTEFEVMMYHFQSDLKNKAKHCGGTGCRRPYFLATKKGQQHCSKKCAKDAKRKCNREWWRENRAKNGELQ